MAQATTNKMLSFLDPARPQPWASFIEQIDRVAPHLGRLGFWLDTLKRETSGSDSIFQTRSM